MPNCLVSLFHFLYDKVMLILTDESPWPLFDDLDAECAGRVGLVRVALHGHVALRLERPVDSAVVILPVEIWVVVKYDLAFGNWSSINN